MDNVSELTARATTYVVLLQDAWALPPLASGQLLAAPGPPDTEPWATTHLATLYDRIYTNEELRAKALALATSTSRLDGSPVPADTEGQWSFFKARTWHLLHFVQTHATVAALQQLFAHTSTALSQSADNYLLRRWPPVWQAVATLLSPAESSALPSPKHHFLPPEQWRRALRQLLYEAAGLRVELATALDYLPTLVLNRIKKSTTELLAARTPAVPTESWDYYLQLSDKELALELQKAQLALPFELVFDHELAEIAERRTSLGLPAHPRADPQLHADELGLCALAFSGGGIRSATFNLGLLQGLARAGWLPRFDYLSTVSGGGYLGSWLAAWVKREGSLRKVADRLCPDKAPVPNAEEVRPIRWLRMYSNYLAPRAGAFSTDAWTMGITWLRNTLLNQLIIVLALGAVLALGSALLNGWFLLAWSSAPAVLPAKWQVGLFSGLLLGLAAAIASIGMQMYWNTSAQLLRQWILLLVMVLQGLAFAGAYLVSGFMYHAQYPGFWQACGALWPAAGAALLALLAVATVGRYDRCFHRVTDQKGSAAENYLIAWLGIVGASALAAAVGLAGLAGVWKIMNLLHGAYAGALGTKPWDPRLPLVPLAGPAISPRSQELLYAAFIFGVPLVLETVVLTVVTRMALLGRNFPDERREWWGRVGAAAHLTLLVWIVLASSSLLARELAWLVPQAGAKLAAAGGWLALVGRAVQLAFSGRTKAQPGQATTTSWLDRTLSLAPYVFGLGLLLLVAGSLYKGLHSMPTFLKGINLSTTPQALVYGALGLSLLLGLLALGLGWRVGVNEFSLHHFYRNRLVRAYLGASRPRFQREREANPFTGFDSHDDLKLSSLHRHAPPPPPDPTAPPQAPRPPYDGPYLLINATLNATKITDLAQQSRQAESFVFTPLYCGFDFARVRAVNPTKPTFEFGYRPTAEYAYPDQGPGVGTAMAISGAAANPNEGYHSSPATAFLLTLFNVRLGWWMGNPSHPRAWQNSDPGLGIFYLFRDLFGRSNTSDKFVNLSDGGHFDNMGLYELVRRRCRYLVLGDGEEDHLFTCDGLANAIRRCRVDFGVEIAIDVTPITNRQGRYSRQHYAVGTIRYPEDAPDQPSGYLLYVKSSLTGDEPTDVREYAQTNDSFPHQSTGDQFFDEAQFESYRRLGLHIFETLASQCKAAANPPTDLKTVFRQFLAACSPPAPEAAHSAPPPARAAARSRRVSPPPAPRARPRS